MGNDIVLDVRKQSYLFGNKNLGLSFDSPRLHHFLLGNSILLLRLTK